MDELVEELAEAVATPQPVPVPNRGHFRPGDPRINRGGRPKGAVAAAGRHARGQLPCGRLQELILHEADLCHRLAHEMSYWITNLPEDAEIVGVRMDRETKGITFLLHSERFPLVEEGQPVPHFQPACYGMKWRQPATLLG